jgi:hypothetical protein
LVTAYQGSASSLDGEPRFYIMAACVVLLAIYMIIDISLTCLFLFALSAAGAIFLILELSRPFTGLMMISSGPLRNALGAL